MGCDQLLIAQNLLEIFLSFGEEEAADLGQELLVHNVEAGAQRVVAHDASVCGRYGDAARAARRTGSARNSGVVDREAVISTVTAERAILSVPGIFV